MKRQFITVTLLIFVIICAVLFILNTYTHQLNIIVLASGNLIMALLTISAYLIVNKQMKGSPAAFVRGVSGSALLKLMVCMLATLIYVALNRSNIQKSTIFALFGIYIIYATAETLLLSKMARQGK